MSIAIAWCVALILCAVSLWIRHRRRRRNPFNTRSGVIVNPPKMAAMPNASNMLVFVNEDGSVRELTEDEKVYRHGILAVRRRSPLCQIALFKSYSLG